MGTVEVVDRGAREIVVFLSGDIDDSNRDALDRAIDEVTALEELNDLSHAVVDMQGVTSLDDTGIAFLRRLNSRGERAGFDVSFSTMSASAHRAVEDAGWSFVEHSPTVPE
jgi:anti-anti-sigma factor